MPERKLRPYEHDQIFLSPPALREWLPVDHLASFVADRDLTPTLTTYGDVTRGTVPSDPRDPRMRFGVLLYAYAVGAPAVRQIDRETPARTREVPDGALTLGQTSVVRDGALHKEAAVGAKHEGRRRLAGGARDDGGNGFISRQNEFVTLSREHASAVSPYTRHLSRI